MWQWFKEHAAVVAAIAGGIIALVASLGLIYQINADTRQEIRIGDSETRQEVRAVNSETRQEIRTGDSETRQEIRAVNSETRLEIRTGDSETRQEIREEIGTVNDNIDSLGTHLIEVIRESNRELLHSLLNHYHGEETGAPVFTVPLGSDTTAN